MTVNDLETLYDYAYWANKKLFPVILQLTPDEFTKSVAGSYGSIRNTLVHVLSAEWGWLSRCGGKERPARLNPADYPTAESLIEMWTKVEGYMREFLSKLRDEDLARDAVYANEKGEKRAMPFGELMQHGANHGVHHRGQVMLMIRELGHKPVDVDILFYYAEKRGVPAF